MSRLAEHSWTFGQVTPQAERVEVALPDGRTLVARVNSGWYFASWISPPAAGGNYPSPVKVVAYTATTAYTLREGGKITQKPR